MTKTRQKVSKKNTYFYQLQPGMDGVNHEFSVTEIPGYCTDIPDDGPPTVKEYQFSGWACVYMVTYMKFGKARTTFIDPGKLNKWKRLPEYIVNEIVHDLDCWNTDARALVAALSILTLEPEDGIPEAMRRMNLVAQMG